VMRSEFSTGGLRRSRSRAVRTVPDGTFDGSVSNYCLSHVQCPWSQFAPRATKAQQIMHQPALRILPEGSNWESEPPAEPEVRHRTAAISGRVMA
jgi:hypothetical protein